MYYLISKSNNPFFNLAVEEVLLKNDNRDFLIFYINDPSVIIGKHQTAHKEADTRFTAKNDIPVIRRITGGGTVYHDNGNLNFSFIKNSEKGRQVDFRRYTAPVTGFLRSLGIEARFEGKNDIRVNGLKISGNAEHVYRERVLHHGTILFDASLSMLGNSIRKDTSCYSTRSVRSNPAEVTNLKEMLPGVRDIYDFRDQAVSYMIRETDGMNPYELDHKHLEDAGELAAGKYHSWDWNYAYGPEYSFSNHFTWSGVEHSCNFFVKEGIIRESRIQGTPDLVLAAERLVGCRHMPGDISAALVSDGSALCNLDIFNFF